MIFWKRKKIVVDAFTMNEMIASTPIDSTAKYLPDWYKSLKNKRLHQDELGLLVETGTFKNCVGFLDTMKRSFTLPMWADLVLRVNNDDSYTFKYPGGGYNYDVSQHGREHLNNAFSSMVHVKIGSPWLLKEKTEVYFSVSQATWSFNNFGGDCLIAPGVVNYKHQHSTHINMFLKGGKQYNFAHRQAMLYIHPLTEDEVEIKTHVIEEKEYNKMRGMWPTFRNGYKNYKTNKEQKCIHSGMS